MAIRQPKLELNKYQFGIDIRKRKHIYGKNDKIISLAKWMQHRTDTPIIVEMITDMGKREAFFYEELNGDNHIIRTFGYIENDFDHIIYVQEFAQQGDLASLLFDTPLSQLILIEMFKQIADAMSYVASKSIVHGDLGCRNIFVFRLDQDQPKNNLIKITDFGLARSLNGLSNFENSSIIPKRYCALEILRNDGHQSSYSEKSDVYSMGVLMWEALSISEFPYSYITDDRRVEKTKLDGERLKRPPSCDKKLWNLIKHCWEDEPAWRSTFIK